MNERIQELYKQSSKQDYFPRDSEEVYMSAKDLEKFAELIVRECVDRGNDLAKHYIDKHSEKEQVHLLAAIADYSNEIRKHFGVEE